MSKSALTSPLVQTIQQALNGLGSPAMAARRLQPVIIALLEGAAALMTGWLLSKLLWLLLTGPTVEVGALPARDFATLQVPRQQDLSILSSFDPFAPSLNVATAPRLSGARAGIDTAGDDIAPETSLKLSLFGLRHDTQNPDAGSAIIQLPNGTQGTFEVGENIIKGVTLARVFPNWVEIRRDGRAESLFFKGDTPESVKGATKVATPRTAASREGARPDNREEDQESRSSRRRADKRARLKRAPRLAARDLQSLLANIEMVPRRENNQITGWTLSPRGTGTLFRSVGLQAGDILIAVNGLQLTAADRLAGLFDHLQGASTVNLDLERGGESRTLTLNYEG